MIYMSDSIFNKNQYIIKVYDAENIDNINQNFNYINMKND